MDYKDNNKSAWNEPFFKERNIGKCLSVGVSLMSNRFLKVIRLAAPLILFAAILFTILAWTFCKAGFECGFADSLVFRIFSTLIIMLNVAILAAFAYRCVDVNIEGLNIYSIGFKFIYNREFWRKVVVAFAIIAVAVITTALCIAAAHATVSLFPDTPDGTQNQGGVDIMTFIVYGIMVAIAMVLTVPLYMALNRMMIEKNHFYLDFKQGYMMGWKKWGRIFALELFINLILAVMAVFVLSPAYVTSLMMHSATLSRLQGDAVDIPAYFSLITICVLFFSSVIWTIFIIARFIPHAYFYANAVSEDKEYDNNENKK